MSFFVPIPSFRRLTGKFRNDRVWMNLDSGSCYKKHLKGLNRLYFLGAKTLMFISPFGMYYSYLNTPLQSCNMHLFYN